MALAFGEFADESKVDEADGAVGLDQHVSWVEISVEVSVFEDHLQQDAHHHGRDILHVCVDVWSGFGGFIAADIGHGQDALCGEISVHTRDDHAWEVFEVFGNLRMWFASWWKSSSRLRARSNSRTMPTGSMSSSSGMMPRRRAAIKCKMWISLRICGTIFGRWILTTTSRPLGRMALWTWAMEAEASASVSMDWKTSSGGLPSSLVSTF